MKYLIVAMSGILVSAALLTVPAQAGEESQGQPQPFDLQRALEALIPKQGQPPQEEPKQEEAKQEQPKQEELKQEEPKQEELVGTLFSLRINENDSEVSFVLKFMDKNEPFRFKLLDDDKLPVHKGWLDMLRDALNNNWKVHALSNLTPDGYVVQSLAISN